MKDGLRLSERETEPESSMLGTARLYTIATPALPQAGDEGETGRTKHLGPSLRQKGP